MPKKPRESRGQEARSTVTWPAQDQRRRPAQGSPEGSPPLSPFAFRLGFPGRAPPPTQSTPTPARGAEHGSPRRGAAQRLQLGHLPSPQALHHQWEGWRPGSGESAGTGWEAAGAGGGGPKAVGAGPKEPARGDATPGVLRGFPGRDFDLLRWAKPSAEGAQDHVWFCGFFFFPPRGRVAPTGGW